MGLKSRKKIYYFFSTCDFKTSISHFCLWFTSCHRSKQLKVDRERSTNTDWGSVGGWRMTEQRPTRKPTYRLEVADAIKGQSEGTGARRESRRWKSKRETKKGRQQTEENI